MKNILKILIGIVLVLSFALSIKAIEPSGSTDIGVTLISQDPDPVNPGRVVDLRWKIENLGRDSAENFQFEIIPEYPFSLYSGELTRDLGTIGGRQIGDEGAIVHYKVKVDEGAVEGTNEIKVRYKWNNYDWIISDVFYIRIQTVDATLSLEEVDVSPAIIVPGENAEISVKLRNLADSLMKDISFKLELSSADIPFAPVGSATEKKVKTLSSGKEVELEFNIISDPNAESGVYKIPVTMTYYDELETMYTKSDIITVIVGSTPDLSIFLDSTDIIKPGDRGEVSIRFVNRGISDVKLLDVVLSSSEDYEILSSGYVYLGNIDSDDYETADFNLWVKPAAPSEVSLPLHIEYKDANNNEYVLDKEVMLKLYSKREAQKIGLVKGSNTIGIVIVVVIVVAGLIIFRIWHKRKKKKQ